MNYRNERAFAAGQYRWDNAAPPDDVEEWGPCDECGGEGEFWDEETCESIPCTHCAGKGGFLENEPMSREEWLKMIEPDWSDR